MIEKTFNIQDFFTWIRDNSKHQVVTIGCEDRNSFWVKYNESELYSKEDMILFALWLAENATELYSHQGYYKMDGKNYSVTEIFDYWIKENLKK